MKHQRLFQLGLIIVLALALPSPLKAAFSVAETDNLTVDTRDAPTVTTPTNTSITADSATLGGTVTADGGATISERGVVIAATATNANPLIGGTSVTKIVASGTTGIFTTSVTGLTPGTGYSFKAFATNAAGTSYTAVATFTTLAFPDIAVEDEASANLTSGSSTKNLGSVFRGASGSALTFTVRNTGQVPLTGLALSKVGGHAADFVLGSLGSTSVPGGGNTTFTLTFSPSAVGPRSTALHIASNDPDGAENPFVIALSGTGLNNPPTDITLSNASVPEDSPVGTVVGTLGAADADAGDTFTFALVSGTGSTDNARFTLNGTALQLATVPDFETQSSYSIRLRVTDSGGGTFEEVLTVQVSDVQEPVNEIVIAGSSAFRAVIHQALIQFLGGGSKCKYAFAGTSGIAGAETAIFEGHAGGNFYLVRTSLQGSLKGISDVIQGNSVEGFLDASATATDRIIGGRAINPAGKTASAAPRFVFSDCNQNITPTPAPALTGQAIAVLPYVFVANPGAPTSLTNITDQVFSAQWSLGEMKLSAYTGNASHTSYVLTVGGSPDSGMRSAILSETRFGPFTLNVQYSSATLNGTEGTGTVSSLDGLGNTGFPSAAVLRSVLSRRSASTQVGGAAPSSVILVGYLPLPDAAAITSVTGGAGVGSIALNYNGFGYSAGNVANGAYTLWSYEYLYKAPNLSGGESTFISAFEPSIPSVLTGQNAIRLDSMNVLRFGGDGGIVLP